MLSALLIAILAVGVLFLLVCFSGLLGDLKRLRPKQRYACHFGSHCNSALPG
jgi:hypothetical protein